MTVLDDKVMSVNESESEVYRAKRAFRPKKAILRRQGINRIQPMFNPAKFLYLRAPRLELSHPGRSQHEA